MFSEEVTRKLLAGTLDSISAPGRPIRIDDRANRAAEKELAIATGRMVEIGLKAKSK
ncbi:MAG: hypothetical protein ACXVAM_19440 [Vulcanimicrobiaceae bacterium]